MLSWHLRHLEAFGLVREWDGGTDARERWWQAVAKGIRFDLPAGPEGRAAFEKLQAGFIRQALGEAQSWLVEVSPNLDDTWAARSDGANTRLMITRDEAVTIQSAIEELLAPYLASTREPERSYWASSAISQFGDRVTELALALIAITVLHASTSEVGSSPPVATSPRSRVTDNQRRPSWRRRPRERPACSSDGSSDAT